MQHCGHASQSDQDDSNISNSDGKRTRSAFDYGISVQIDARGLPAKGSFRSQFEQSLRVFVVVHGELEQTHGKHLTRLATFRLIKLNKRSIYLIKLEFGGG